MDKPVPVETYNSADLSPAGEINAVGLANRVTVTRQLVP